MHIKILPGVKALIFDIDGTLADTMPSHFKAFKTVLEHYGIEFTEELFHSFAGVPVGPQMVQIKALFNPDNFNPEKVAVAKEEEYRKTLHLTKPIQPVLDVMLNSYGKLPLGCGTGSDAYGAARTLEAIGVTHMVDALVTCDDVINGKPAPDTFLMCAERLGVEPKYCQVFEDGEPGIDAALAAGMQVTDIRKYV